MSAAAVRGTGVAAGLTATVVLGAGIVAAVMLPGGEPTKLSDLIWFASFLTFPLAGLLILWHRPDNAVGWLFVAVGLAQAVAAAAGLVSQVILLHDPAESWGAGLLLVSYVGLTVAWVLATTYPFLLFPDGRLPSRRWRWVVFANTLCLGLAVLSIVVKPGSFGSDDPVNPLGVSALGGLPGLVLAGSLIACLLVSVFAVISLVLRWHRGIVAPRRCEGGWRGWRSRSWWLSWCSRWNWSRVRGRRSGWVRSGSLSGLRRPLSRRLWLSCDRGSST